MSRRNRCGGSNGWTTNWQQSPVLCCLYFNNQTGRTTSRCFRNRQTCPNPPRGNNRLIGTGFLNDCSQCTV